MSKFQTNTGTSARSRQLRHSTKMHAADNVIAIATSQIELY